MLGNHLEALVSEFYQLQGYFVRRHIQVGKKPSGGYECELNVVVFHPGTHKLLHVEPSLDALTWKEREPEYLKKFQAGRQYIPTLFEGLSLPGKIEQIALFVFGAGRTTLAGGRVLSIGDFMVQVHDYLHANWRNVRNAAIPEEYPLLRTLQFAAEYWPNLNSTKR